jgi:hypothetical protein
MCVVVPSLAASVSVSIALAIYPDFAYQPTSSLLLAGFYYSMA